MAKQKLAGRAVENPQSVPQGGVVKTMLGRLKIRLNRARNLKGPELLGMNNCLVVFTFEGRREESTVKVNDIAPVWNEEVFFDNIPYPPSSKVAITIVYQSGSREEVLGVAAPGQNLWTTNAAHPQDRWLPIATKEGIYAGELNFHIHWTKTEVKYRPPVVKIIHLVEKTQLYTKPIDKYIDAALGGVLGVATYLHDTVSNFSPLHKGLAIAAVASAAAVAFVAVLLPSIIFFPITFLVLTGTFFASLVVVPIVSIITWFLVCSPPVQTKLVQPALEFALKNSYVKSLLTEEKEVTTRGSGAH